jgi:hypothetical protein
MCRIMGHLPGRRLWHLSRLVRRTDGEMRIGEELEIGSDQQLGRRLDHHFRVVHNCLQGLFGRGRSTMITPSCVSGRRRHPRLFWERLSYFFRDSTIGSQVVKVERVQQTAICGYQNVLSMSFWGRWGPAGPGMDGIFVATYHSWRGLGAVYLSALQQPLQDPQQPHHHQMCENPHQI